MVEPGEDMRGVNTPSLTFKTYLRVRIQLRYVMNMARYIILAHKIWKFTPSLIIVWLRHGLLVVVMINNPMIWLVMHSVVVEVTGFKDGSLILAWEGVEDIRKYLREFS